MLLQHPAFIAPPKRFFCFKQSKRYFWSKFSTSQEFEPGAGAKSFFTGNYLICEFKNSN
jgi:hypothetical protein